MRKIFWILLSVLLCFLLCTSVFASEIEDALMDGISPEAGLDAQVRGELGAFDAKEGGAVPGRLRELVLHAFDRALGDARDCLKTIGLILAAVLLCGLLEREGGRAASLAGVLLITLACTGSLRSMLTLGTETIRQTNQYSLLLLPGLSSLMAASGSFSGAAALYAGSVFFLQLLMRAISGILVPLLYLFVALSAAEAAMELELLSQLREFVKWLTVGTLKAIVYIFTGYMTLTGLLSGSADASRLKAARLAVSGAVPIVGGILSDASQTVLSAALSLKNAVGVYGMLAVLALCLTPFLRIALQYLILRAVAAVCGFFGRKNHVALLGRLCEAMGVVTGMTGAYCLMALLSIILCIRAVGV